MTGKDTLQETVATLISRRAERTYWDFKRCHHRNKDNLIHDILCLANARHQGSRFLKFGVDDKDFSLHSISSDTGRRTQADIASLFRDNANKFFQSRFPEFYLTEVSINGALIDVLVVEDTSHKPYYLIERYGNTWTFGKSTCHSYGNTCSRVDIECGEDFTLQRGWFGGCCEDVIGKSGQGYFIETQGGEVGKQRRHAVSRIAAGSLFGTGFLCCRL